MSEKMTRDDIIRMARESGFAKGTEPHSVVVRHSNGSWVGVYAELNVFAYKVIEHFLDTTGQYVTNDASREAAIHAAVEAEREACAEIAASTVCDEHIPTGIKIYGTRAARAIRARSEK